MTLLDNERSEAKLEDHTGSAEDISPLCQRFGIFLVVFYVSWESCALCGEPRLYYITYIQLSFSLA